MRPQPGVLFALSLLALCTAGLGSVRPAHACGAPAPSPWRLTDSAPQQGETVAPDEGIRLRIARDTSEGPSLSEVLRVGVRCDGQAAPGQLVEAAPELFHWQPEPPLPLGTSCEVQLRFEYDAELIASWPEFQEATHEYTWAIKVGTLGDAPQAQLLSAVAEEWIYEEKRCLEPDYQGDCHVCRDFETVRTETRARLQVTVAAPDLPQARAYTAILVKAKSIEALSPVGGSAAEQLWDADQVQLSTDLGLAAEWAGQPVCFRVDWQRPNQERTLGEPQCLDIQPLSTDERQDGGVPPTEPDGDISINPLPEPTPNRLEGCSATPTHGPARALWALLLVALPLLRRRPTR